MKSALDKPFSYYPLPIVRYSRGGKLYAEGDNIDEDYSDESKWTKHTGHWDINDSNRESITEQKLVEEALNRGITNMRASSQYDDAGNVIGIDAEYYTPVQSSFKRPTHDEIHFVKPNATYSTDGTPVNIPSNKTDAEVADTDLLQLNPQDIVPSLDPRTASQREVDELTRLGFSYADTIRPSYISAQAPSINTLQGRRAAQNIYDRAKSNQDANVGIPQSYNTYMQAMPLQDTIREGANDFAYNYAYPTLAALATPMAFEAAAPAMQLMDPRFYGALVERFGPQIAQKIISNPAVLDTFINTAIPALSGTAQVAAASAIDVPMLYHGITGLGKDAIDYLNHEYEWNQLPQTAMNAMGLMAAKPLAGFAKGIYNTPIPEFNSSELNLLSNNNKGRSLRDIVTNGKNAVVKKYEDLRGITADQAVVDNIRKRQNDAWEEVKKTNKAEADARDKRDRFNRRHSRVYIDSREDVNLGKVAVYTKSGTPIHLQEIDSDSDISVNSFDNYFESVLGEYKFQSTESSVGSGVATEHELGLDFTQSGIGRESIVGWKPYAKTAEVPSKARITQPRINFSGRNPKEITSQIKSYVDFINQKLNVGGVQKGIVGGSSVLYANGFGVGVPHDLEIITTEDNLDDVIRILEVTGIDKNRRNRANTITGGRSKWSIKTSDSKTGKTGDYEIDIQVIKEDPNTKEALGINTHETLRAIKPELYYDWAQSETKDAVEKSIGDTVDDSRKLSELLVTNPDTGKPFTSQELFNLLAEEDNILTKTLCDQFWAEPRPENNGKQVMRVITYMTSPDVSAEQFNKILTTSMRASIKGFKSLFEDCPNIDYKDVEANKEFLRSIGMPTALASDEEIVKKIAVSYYQYASVLNRSVWINDPNGKSIFSFKDFLNSVVAVQHHHGGNAAGQGGNNTAFGTWASKSGGFGVFFSTKQVPIKNGTKISSTSQLFDYYVNQDYDRELTEEEINKIFSELGFTAKDSDGLPMSIEEVFERLYGQEDKIKKLSDILNISYLRNPYRTDYDEYRGNVSSFDTEDTRIGVYVGETPEQGGLFKGSKVNSLEKANSQIIREEKPISDRDVTTFMQATATLPKKESDELYNLLDAEDNVILDLEFTYGDSTDYLNLNDSAKARQAALSLGIPESEWRDAYSKLQDIQDQKSKVYKRVHDLYNEFFEIVNDTKLSDDERAEKLVEYLELHDAELNNTFRSQKGFDLIKRYEYNIDDLVDSAREANRRAREEHKNAQSDEGIAIHLESKIRAKRRKDIKMMKGLASTMAIVAGSILLGRKIKNTWIPSDSTPSDNSENENDNE